MEIPATLPSFLDDILVDFVLAKKAQIGPFKVEYKQLLDKLHSHFTPEIHEKMGMITPDISGFAADYKPRKTFRFDPRTDAEKKMILLKLSHYQHKTYGDVYWALVSQPEPNSYYTVVQSGWAITRIEGEWKVILVSNFDSDTPRKPWFVSYGLPGLTPGKLGKFIGMQQLHAPAGDAGSLAEFEREA